MKRIAILTVLILAAVSAFGQAARVDLPLLTAGPSVPISGGPLPQALWVANAAAYLCTHPSVTLVACQAAPITTYTDSTEGTTCPTAAPLVQLPGNTCTASTGTAANVGLWYSGGLFDYWIVSSYGTYGPFSGNSSNSALPSSCGNPVGIPCGGTGSSTAAGALANLGGAAISGAAFTGPISAPFYNTIPQADQFAGADMCAKTRAAATYALANGINQVDATHFSGTQACATDMLGAIATFSNSSINLVVNLGAVHIRSSVAQTITNPGVTLHGMGPMHTQLEYIGVSLIPAVLTVAPPSPSRSVTNTVDQVEGIFIYGDLANATDALLIQATNHSQFRSVWTWGVTNCGIHTEYAVTDSFITPRTSMWSARALLGSTYNTAYTVPSHGLCFDVLAGGGTTNGTVQDAAAEGLTGAGWWLANGSGMTFTSGTSEGNLAGVQLDSGSVRNTFIDSDFEGNSSGNDILDNGVSNIFTNPIAVSVGSLSDLIIGSTSIGLVIDGGVVNSQTIQSGANGYKICNQLGQCTLSSVTASATGKFGSYVSSGSTSRTGLKGDLLFGLSGNGAIHSDSNWGMTFTADTTSPAVADYYFMNSAGVGRFVLDNLGNFGVGTSSTASSDAFYVTLAGAVRAVSYANANGPVIPQTALGYQGPAAGYVQLAPSATGTPGYLYDNGSGTRSWNPFTTVQASVASSNVTMTTAGTYYDGPTTGSQAAGTWLIQGTVSLQTSATPTAAINFTCKLWDGTTIFSSTGAYIELTTVGATKDISLSLSAVATEAGAATFKISCTSDTASQLILYQTAYGSVANASSISAVRIK
jgi:hypothetical protein